MVPLPLPGPRKIYLGPKFFDACDFVFMTDSKVSTILHELSHFRDICALKDISYDYVKSGIIVLENSQVSWSKFKPKL